MTSKENTNSNEDYPARLETDYPEGLNRLTTFFRLLWIIPIAIVLSLFSRVGETVTNTIILNEAGAVISISRQTAGGLANGLFLATVLLTLFRQLYPRWWFDFSRELARFGAESSPTCSCSPTNIRQLSKSSLSTWKSTTQTGKMTSIDGYL